MVRVINETWTGPLEVCESTVISAPAESDIVVLDGAELVLKGEITGSVTVRPGGALVLIGRVKGVVVNEGGAVDIFGYVGKVVDAGSTETYVSRGAIIGGKRASRPSKLSAMG